MRLLDVAPDGSAHLIGRGQRRIRDVGDRRHVVVSLAHLGYRLREGHRLRLHVASSDFPDFVDTPGTDEHPWLAVETERNLQSVVIGGAHGARLRLTVAAADIDAA